MNGRLMGAPVGWVNTLNPAGALRMMSNNAEVLYTVQDSVSKGDFVTVPA